MHCSWLLNVLVVGSSGMFESGSIMRLLEFEKYDKMNTDEQAEFLVFHWNIVCIGPTLTVWFGHLQKRRG